MKKLIFLKLLFAFSVCVAQNGNNRNQEKLFDEANEKLKSGNKKGAYFSFNNAYLIDHSTEKGKIALQKADSLRDLLRKKFLNEIVGNWKLKESGSNWGMIQANRSSETEAVDIQKKRIDFYLPGQYSDEIKATQKIKFNDEIYDFSYFFELVYDDNQLWRITLNNDNTLRFVNSGKIENGEILLNVCGNEERIYSKH